MPDTGTFSLGIALLLLGAGLFMLPYILAVKNTAAVVSSEDTDSDKKTEEYGGSQDAVMVIAPNGRIVSMNKIAREWFQHNNKSHSPLPLSAGAGRATNLERVARSVRPHEAFLMLCAGESTAMLSLNGRNIEGVSYKIPNSHILVILHQQASVRALAVKNTATVKNSSPVGQDDHVLLEQSPDQDSLDLAEISQKLSAGLDLDATIICALETLESMIYSDYAEIVILAGQKPHGAPSTWDGQEYLDCVEQHYHLSGVAGEARQLKTAVESYPGDGSQSNTTLLERHFAPSVHGESVAAEDDKPTRLSLMGYLASSSQPLLVSEIDSSLKGEPFPGPFNSILGIPLIYHPESSPAAGAVTLKNAAAVKNPKSTVIGGLLFYALAENAYTPADMEALQRLAGPITIALRNALIYQAEQRRARELSSLVKMATAFSTIQEPESLFASLVENISALADVEVLGFLVYDENRRMLIGQPPFQGIPANLIEWSCKVSIQADSPAESVWRSQEVIQSEEAPDDPQIVALGLHHFARAASLHQIVLTPLVSRAGRNVGPAETITDSRDDGDSKESITANRMVGYLLAANKRDQSDFDTSDLRILSLVAGQAGAMIENAALIQQSDRRAQRAETFRRIASLVASTASVDEILRYSMLDLARLLVADVGAIFLLDGTHGELCLHTDSQFGLPPDISQQLSHLSIHHPDYQKTAAARKDQLVSGEIAENESLTPNKALAPFFQPIILNLNIRSIIEIPLVVRDRSIGEVVLGSIEPDFFKPGDLLTAMTAASQLASAIERAALYSQTDQGLRRRGESLSKLLETSQVLLEEHPLAEALDEIARAIQSATPFESVLISVYREELKSLERVASAGIPPETLIELRSHTQPWERICSLLRPEFRLGMAYFLPVEQAPIIPIDIHTVTLTLLANPANGDKEHHQQNCWDADDMLLVPLASASGEPLGMISVDTPRDGLRPDRTTIETLELFGSQAALVIENRFKIARLSGQLEESQTELQEALKNPNLRARADRIRAVVEIADTLQDQPDQEGVLLAFGAQILRQLDFQAVLIAESAPQGIRLVHALGLTTGNINDGAQSRQDQERRLETLLGQKNPLSSCLQKGEQIIIPDLNENKEWKQAPLLQALGARAAICLPILSLPDPTKIPTSSRQHRLAVLATRQEPLPVELVEDQKLYQLLAKQASIALQNLSLMEETRCRLKEVDLLLEFSSRLGSLDPSSILASLVESALQVVPNAEAAMLVTWKPGQLPDTGFARAATGPSFPDDTGRLIPIAACGYPNPNRLSQIQYQPGEAIVGQVFQTGQPLRLEEVVFSKHYNLSPKNLSLFRDATNGCLPLSSMAIPLLSRAVKSPVETAQQAANTPNPHNVLGVLVLDRISSIAGFTEEDQALVTSLARQTTLSLENARLYQASEGRAQQLQALNEVATTISSSLQSQALIDTLLDQLKSILPYDTGTLWLREDTPAFRSGGVSSQSSSPTMIVRAARGFSDSDQRLGLSISVEDSALLAEMSCTGRPIAVGNIQEDPRFLHPTLAVEDFSVEDACSATVEKTALTNNPASPSYVHSVPKYELLSWLGIPLIASREVIGVIALEKKEAHFYSPASTTGVEYLQLATTFASQAAVALANADMYQASIQRSTELDKRSKRLAILNRLSSELSSSLNLDHILGIVAGELSQVLHCTSVSTILFETTEGSKYIATESTTHIRLPEAPIFERLRESLGVFHSEDVNDELELAPLQDFLAERGTKSLLILPLVTASDGGGQSASEQRLEGLLFVHNDHPYHFELDEIELARTISNQVAVAVQNARLYARLLGLTEELERRVLERTAELRREHQRSETLLHIITELSASLDLDQVLHSTLHVLNDVMDAEQITVLIARPGEEKLHRLASVGYADNTPRGGSATPFNLDQGLGGWIVCQRQPALIEDILQDPRWIQIPGLVERHRSALGVPLMIGAEALGALLLFHRQINHFSSDQLDLVQAAANQVAIAVNNAELYRLIRDQAEDLGNMLRQQQIETSRSKAILEAVADGVLVTDANRQITLFNASAEMILNLQRSQVIGKSLEYFTGLFGNAARSWMETIQALSQPGYERSSLEWQNPAFAGALSNQITLENGRVISVHLAPVIWRNEFLGTVSIFQDITHQVEVDRLKSEFVSTVSHELRTPITSIKGYVEILLMGMAGPLESQQAHFLQIVKSNTDRLTILVNDLLDISRIESGRIQLNLEALNLSKVVEDVISDLARRSKEDDRRIQIESSVPTNLPRILGDAVRVRQVISNLLDNAYNYNLPDGRIVVRMQQVNGNVQVDVKDTGMGIPPTDHQRVFERFYRGDNTLVLGIAGSGLGLSIVKNLVEMHQGRIWFESRGIAGEGTTFSFTLPVYGGEEHRGGKEHRGGEEQV